jgi:outer membrane lipopolysaccharide assembly protein LptE/RlpB
MRLMWSTVMLLAATTLLTACGSKFVRGTVLPEVLSARRAC